MRAMTLRTLAILGLAAGSWLVACKPPAPVPAGGDATVAPIAAAAAAGATATAPEAAGKGRIEVAEKSVDLGDIRQGDKATHTFILKNVGTDVLHIRRAKGS